jgi:predicted component of type VI protein secretion system
VGLFEDYKNKNGETSVEKLVTVEFVLKNIDNNNNADITLDDNAESSSLPTTGPIITILQTIRNNLKWLFNNKAPINTTLTDASESSTLPAISSTTITTLLQTIRNNLKYLFNNKAPINATLSDAAESSTLPATTSTAITTLLQIIRNNLKYLINTSALIEPASSTFTTLLLNKTGESGTTSISKGWYKITIMGGAGSYARSWVSGKYSGYYGGHGGGFSSVCIIGVGLFFCASGGKGQDGGTTGGTGDPGYGGMTEAIFYVPRTCTLRYLLGNESTPGGEVTSSGTTGGSGGFILYCLGGTSDFIDGVGMFGDTHNVREPGKLVLYKSTSS